MFNSPILDVFVLLQARYLAQIIVMGAQVVGRAFARALQQEYAGMTRINRLFVSFTGSGFSKPRYKLHFEYQNNSCRTGVLRVDRFKLIT